MGFDCHERSRIILLERIAAFKFVGLGRVFIVLNAANKLNSAERPEDCILVRKSFAQCPETVSKDWLLTASFVTITSLYEQYLFNFRYM